MLHTLTSTPHSYHSQFTRYKFLKLNDFFNITYLSPLKFLGKQTTIHVCNLSYCICSLQVVYPKQNTLHNDLVKLFIFLFNFRELFLQCQSHLCYYTNGKNIFWNINIDEAFEKFDAFLNRVSVTQVIHHFELIHKYALVKQNLRFLNTNIQYLEFLLDGTTVQRT